LAAIIGAILVPIYAYWLTQHHILVPLILISLILLWRHGENIKRLLKGQEDKITFKKK
jgi:glycerol-3-phosphate acyltransferase PlsY